MIKKSPFSAGVGFPVFCGFLAGDKKKERISFFRHPGMQASLHANGGGRESHRFLFSSASFGCLKRVK